MDTQRLRQRYNHRLHKSLFADWDFGADVFPLAAEVPWHVAETAIMLLVEDGKVSLDDSLSDYIDNAPAAWKKIKIRHLLSHTSGLPRTIFRPGTRRWQRIVYRNEELLELAKKRAPLFQAGEKFSYSNLAYFLVGAVRRFPFGRRWHSR